MYKPEVSSLDQIEKRSSPSKTPRKMDDETKISLYQLVPSGLAFLSAFTNQTG